jgi:hypothetical protein
LPQIEEDASRLGREPLEGDAAVVARCPALAGRTRSDGAFVRQAGCQVDHSMRDMEIGAVGLLEATP